MRRTSGDARLRRIGGRAAAAARVRVRAAAAGGLARARGAAYKAPRPAESWPSTAQSRLLFFCSEEKK